ncbi:MAG TPA: M23 family metallopeptidase [Gemmatimonadaceae bacterium]|nr:M23 family metallopeptidase [Gemmatimonadaceae bacterium]
MRNPAVKCVTMVALALVSSACAGPAAKQESLGADSSMVAGPRLADSLTFSAAPLADSVPSAMTLVPDTVAIEMATAAPAGESGILGPNLVIPVQGVIRSQLRDTYGDARVGHAHEALDIMAPRGTPVLSVTSGRLLKLFDSKPGGLMVYAADSSDQYILMYGHLDRYADGLTENMPLVRGQLLGYVGSTGVAPPGTPHLHFAIGRGQPSVKWWKGEPVNPYPLFLPR